MHAAHERIVYERLKRSLLGDSIAAQPLLIPLAFAATPQEIATAEAQAAALHALGLEIGALSADESCGALASRRRWPAPTSSRWRARCSPSWRYTTRAGCSSARRTSCCRRMACHGAVRANRS